MTKNGGNIPRYQSAFISDNEVNKLIKEIKRSQTVQYLDELDEIIKNNDENFDNLGEDEMLISKAIDLIKKIQIKLQLVTCKEIFKLVINKAKNHGGIRTKRCCFCTKSCWKKRYFNQSIVVTFFYRIENHQNI